MFNRAYESLRLAAPVLHRHARRRARVRVVAALWLSRGRAHLTRAFIAIWLTSSRSRVHSVRQHTYQMRARFKENAQHRLGALTAVRRKRHVIVHRYLSFFWIALRRCDR